MHISTALSTDLQRIESSTLWSVESIVLNTGHYWIKYCTVKEEGKIFCCSKGRAGRHLKNLRTHFWIVKDDEQHLRDPHRQSPHHFWIVKDDQHHSDPHRQYPHRSLL